MHRGSRRTGHPLGDGEAERRLGVVSALGDLLVAVGPGDRVVQRSEREEEEGAFELLVTPAGGSLTADRGSRTASRGGVAGVGGKGGQPWGWRSVTFSSKHRAHCAP